MAVNRIQSVLNGVVVEQIGQIEETQTRLNLFNSSTYERVTSVKLDDGTKLEIPTMSSADCAKMAELFAQVPPENQEALQASFDAFSGALLSESQSNPEGIKVGSFSAGLVSQLHLTYEQYMVAQNVDNHSDTIQAIMFGAMVGVESDLATFAKKVQERTKLAGDVRTDIAEIQQELADWPDDGSKRTFSWTETTIEPDGSIKITQHENEQLTKEQAQALMEKLNLQLASLKEINQVDQYDLQRMTHEYQQGLGTLSELMKSQHESLRAIINNTKAS